MSTTGRSYGPPGTEQLSAFEAPTSAFRPVQYLGSKLRVLDALSSAINHVDPGGGRLLDLFSGTGVVAAHFLNSRPVIAVDIQEYARVLAAALMTDVDVTAAEIEALLQEQLTSETDHGEVLMARLTGWESSCIEQAKLGDYDPICALVEDGSIARCQQGEAVRDADLSIRLQEVVKSVQSGTGSVLTRYYGGVYFGYRQALRLDRLAVAARSLAPPVREIALAAVLSTASDLVSSVGSHFAQPVRVRTGAGIVKPSAVRAVVRRRGLDPDAIFSTWLRRYRAASRPRHDGLSLRADFRDQLTSPSLPVSVVYADPPYTRDHYSRYYHVLETIARGDEPGLSTMRFGAETLISRGLYRADRHQSPFCIKSQAPRAFAELIAGARCLEVPLVLSYSPHGDDGATRERVMALGDIEQLAREHYSRVETVRVSGVAHSKLNASRVNSDVVHDAERLVICHV
jgi:adenine-specific DNA methylase